MTPSMTRSDVQDALIGAGTPSALPPLWSGLPQTELVDLPLSRKLLRRLGKEFDRQTLRQAGVVELNAQGSIAFSPPLVENSKYVSVLRREPGGPADDLLLGTARTLSGRPAWAAALEHCELKKLMADGQNQIFVVATPEDYVVMRALGLTVIPAAGLDRLAGAEIETLRGLLDVAPELASGDDGPDASPLSDAEGAIEHCAEAVAPELASGDDGPDATPPSDAEGATEPCAEAVDPDGRSESGPPRLRIRSKSPRRRAGVHRRLARYGRRRRRGSRAVGVAPRLYAPGAAAAATVVRACQFLRGQARP